MTVDSVPVPHLPKMLVFLTWDAPSSSYLTGLFAPILRRLASEYGLQAQVIQATWSPREGEVDQGRVVLLQSMGFSYSKVMIPKILGHAGDIIGLLRLYFGIRAFLRKNSDGTLVVARAPVPALAAIFAARNFPRCKVIFDADGFPIDERVEYGGGDPYGLFYRLMRDVEAYCVRASDAVLVRADAAIDMLLARSGPGVPRGKFSKVRNGRDEKRFKRQADAERGEIRRLLGIANGIPLVCYVGSSFDGKYNGDLMLEVFSKLKGLLPDAHLVLLLERPATAEDVIAKHPELHGAITAVSVAGSEIHAYIAACDLGISLIDTGYSTKAVTATKVGEYLLCGLPVIVNQGCGEIAAKLQGRIFSHYLMDSSSESAVQAARWFVDGIWPNREFYSAEARRFGVAECGLEAAMDDYRRVVEQLFLRDGHVD